MKNLFKDYAANSSNPKWENMIARSFPLYSRDSDIRSEFERDYTRIIHVLFLHIRFSIIKL